MTTVIKIGDKLNGYPVQRGELNALSVTCPYCKAVPGAACTTKAGATYVRGGWIQYHGRRYDAAPSWRKIVITTLRIN